MVKLAAQPPRTDASGSPPDVICETGFNYGASALAFLCNPKLEVHEVNVQDVIVFISIVVKVYSVATMFGGLSNVVGFGDARLRLDSQGGARKTQFQTVLESVIGQHLFQCAVLT